MDELLSKLKEMNCHFIIFWKSSPRNKKKWFYIYNIFNVLNIRNTHCVFYVLEYKQSRKLHVLTSWTQYTSLLITWNKLKSQFVFVFAGSTQFLYQCNCTIWTPISLQYLECSWLLFPMILQWVLTFFYEVSIFLTDSSNYFYCTFDH